jgi:hypothetical protein
LLKESAVSERAKQPHNVPFLVIPHDSVDRIALKMRLRQIGASEGATDRSMESADAD